MTATSKPFSNMTSSKTFENFIDITSKSSVAYLGVRFLTLIDPIAATSFIAITQIFQEIIRDSHDDSAERIGKYVFSTIMSFIFVNIPATIYKTAALITIPQVLSTIIITELALTAIFSSYSFCKALYVSHNLKGSLQVSWFFMKQSLFFKTDD